MSDHRDLNDKQLSNVAGGADDLAPGGGTGTVPGERGGQVGGTEPIDDPDGDADTTTGNNTDGPDDFNR